jgi:hypothetical protein
VKINGREEQRLLEVFKANVAGYRYWADEPPEFDYLRGSGLITNGYGSQYNTMALTQRGLNYIIKQAERLKSEIGG